MSTYTFADHQTAYPLEEAVNPLVVPTNGRHRRLGVAFDPRNCTVSRGLDDLGYPHHEVINGATYVLHPDGIVRRYINNAKADRARRGNDGLAPVARDPFIVLLAPSPTQTLEAKRAHNAAFRARGARNPQPATPQRGYDSQRRQRSGAVRTETEVALD